MTNHNEIHERAVATANRFFKSEADLLVAIQEVFDNKTYLHKKYRNLHSYVVSALNMPDGQAYGYAALVKLSPTVPELKQAVIDGELKFNTARKIVSVINPENKDSWIQMAKDLRQKDLEREVVKVNPRKAVQEGMRPVSLGVTEFRVAISDKLEAKLKRIQDLESQRTKKHCSLEETLEAMADFYLEKNDPVKKAEKLSARIKSDRPVPSDSETIPAAVRHEVNARDKGTCLVPGCGEQRWTDMHHIVPRANGGKHTKENIVTLCSFHHRQEHLSPPAVGTFAPRTWQEHQMKDANARKGPLASSQ